MAEIAFVRNNLVNSHIRVREVQILDYLSEKNQLGPGEVRPRVKAENTTAKIALWLLYAIGSA
jgi:hypothetical protein